MLFPTGIFAIFLAVVFAVHWTLVRHAPGLVRHFLLCASLAFYAFWSATFCVALVVVGLFAWGIGLLAAQGRGTGWLRAGIAGALAWLFWFKYAGFAQREVASALALLGIDAPPALEVLLPVGVSFYVFQAISYMVDVHRGHADAARDPVDVLAYLTFFPHIAAGPIVRAAHFLPQLATPPDARRVPCAMALLLVAGGLFKKMVVANELATGAVDPVFRDPSAHGAADVLLAAYGYTVQIWCDFSGYSDMAIGVAALLGYHFPRNFDQPFRATSLAEFWRRWHVSLSSWLRDYLYVPLGGNRGGRLRTARNLLLTMVLGGIWHGANWTFLCWGALHGAALAAERLVPGLRNPPSSAAAAILRWAITFHVVVACFVLFRAPDLATAGAMAARLLDWATPAETSTIRLVLLAGLGIGLHFLPGDARLRIERLLAGLHPLALGALAGCAAVLVLAAAPEGVAPFIYFQF
jgi:D-alanyl-lipoteichoic acid acyltransferase DltB (MBOAT superfamily)